MTDSGPASLLAVFMTASDHGGGRCSPLSASGMGSAAGGMGSVGSAASSFPPVVTWSGHSIG